MMITKVSIAAKSIFGLVIMKENKTIDRPRKKTRRNTRARKSLRFKAESSKFQVRSSKLWNLILSCEAEDGHDSVPEL
jgi:hypothetical protein